MTADFTSALIRGARVFDGQQRLLAGRSGCR
jgi:hypothetical protein